VDSIALGGTWKDAGRCEMNCPFGFTNCKYCPKMAKSNCRVREKSILSNDAQMRKDTPIARGVLDYFPRAIAEVARVSKTGNDQHNPGEEMHWSRDKSTDHADCIVRHLIDRGKRDTDGRLHSAKAAWRVLAMLEIELEGENE